MSEKSLSLQRFSATGCGSAAPTSAVELAFRRLQAGSRMTVQMQG